MGKMNFSKLFIITLLLLFLQGCYVGPEPGYYDYNYGGPPPIEFGGPPDVIVVPDTYYVYAVPDINVELYFWNGWWWRLWESHWYRSQYYDRGWYYYNTIPNFYFDLNLGWRDFYRDHNWYGHRWNYERIPHHQLKQHWRSWQNDRHWETRGTWGVQNYKPKSQKQRQELRQQRQKQYQQRPQVQQPQRESKEEVLQSQPSQLQEKPKRWEVEDGQ